MVEPFGWYILDFDFDMADDAHDEEEKEDEKEWYLDEVDKWCLERPIIERFLGFDFDQDHVGLVEGKNWFDQHRLLQMVDFDFIWNSQGRKIIMWS